MGLRLADYVVNEAGFAADLGCEKYIDIVMQQSGNTPAAAVLVTTVQSIRNQGEGDLGARTAESGKAPRQFEIIWIAQRSRRLIGFRKIRRRI